MRRAGMWGFRALGILCLLVGLLCIPFSPGVFGTFFFGGLGVCCLAEAYLLQKAERSKGCKGVSRVGVVIFTLFAVSFLAIQGIIQAGMHKDDVQADYVFVLGARVYEDGRPSLTLAKRLDRAKDYLDEHPEAKAVLCGGQGDNEPMPEAEAMRLYLIDRGVADTRLLLEDASRNTIQNIENAKEMLDALGKDYTTVVISSDFHCARARRLMERAGLAGAAIPAETPHLSQRVVMRSREYCSILGLMVTGRW